MQKKRLINLCTYRISPMDLHILNNFLHSLKKQQKRFFISHLLILFISILAVFLFFCFLLKDFSVEALKASAPLLFMICIAYIILFITHALTIRKQISFIHNSLAKHTQNITTCQSTYTYLGSTNERIGNDSDSANLHSVRFLSTGDSGKNVLSFGKNDRHFIYDILTEQHDYKFYNVCNQYIIIIDITNTCI